MFYNINVFSIIKNPYFLILNKPVNVQAKTGNLQKARGADHEMPFSKLQKINKSIISQKVS